MRSVPTSHTGERRPACGLVDESPDLRPLEGADADAELVLLARALGHPIRLQIVRYLLRHGGCHSGRIEIELPLGTSTMSQHLKVLKQAGLVLGEVTGTRNSYCINDRAVRRLRSLVAML